jgi:hypothetical protein
MKGLAMRILLTVFMLVLISLSGCMSYTVLSHPEVEVYDEQLGKYVFEEVTLASNCRSCHQHSANKFDVYRRLLRTPSSSSSLEKIDLLQVRAMPELRGYENYLHSDLGSYYYAAWWFHPIIVESGFYASSAASSGTSASERVRQSYRRSSGRLPSGQVSTAGAPATSSGTSAPSSASSVSTTGTPATGSSASSQPNERRSSSDSNVLHHAPQRSAQYGVSKPDSVPRPSGRQRE